VLIFARAENDIVTYQKPWPMFLLYSLSLGAPISPIGVGGSRVRPVWTHSRQGLLFRYSKMALKLLEKSITSYIRSWSRCSGRQKGFKIYKSPRRTWELVRDFSEQGAKTLDYRVKRTAEERKDEVNAVIYHVANG
jgi:hypothetical protein